MLAPSLRGANILRICFERPSCRPLRQSLYIYPICHACNISPRQLYFSRHKCRSISTAVARADDDEETADDGFLHKVPSESRSNKDGLKRLVLGKLRNKKSGKTFRAKTTPLPVQSFGKPAEVIIINRTNADRKAEERKTSSDQARRDAIHHEAPEQADSRVVAEESEPTSIAAEILESIHEHDHASTPQQNESNTMQAIAQVRPTPPPGGMLQLDAADYRVLESRLVKGFTLKQLQKFRRKHLIQPSRAKHFRIKAISKRWVIVRKHNTQGGKSQAKEISHFGKNIVAVSILRDIWKIHSVEESLSQLSIESQVQPDVVGLLSIGEKSHAQQISKEFGVRISFSSHTSARRSTVGVPKSKLPLVMVQGTMIGVLEASKRIDAIQVAVRKCTQEINLEALKDNSLIWLPYTSSKNLRPQNVDIQGISERSRSLLSHSTGPKPAEDVSEQKSKKIADNSLKPSAPPGSVPDPKSAVSTTTSANSESTGQSKDAANSIKIVAASQRELDYAKCLLSSALGYHESPWQVFECFNNPANKRMDAVYANVPTPLPQPSLLREQILGRRTASSGILSPALSTGVGQDLHGNLKELFFTGSEDGKGPVQTYPSEPLAKRFLSMDVGYHVTTLSSAHEKVQDSGRPGNNLRATPEVATFCRTAPNALSVLRGLAPHSHHSVEKEVKIVLVPDLAYGAFSRVLPKLVATFSTDGDQLHIKTIAHILDEQVHDILLPEYPVDLRFQASATTDITEQIVTGKKLWPDFKDFLASVMARLQANEDLRCVPGPVVKHSLHSIPKRVKQKYLGTGKAADIHIPNVVKGHVDIKYLIKEVSIVEAISFQLPGRHGDDTCSQDTFTAIYSMTTPGVQHPAKQNLSLHMPINDPALTSIKRRPAKLMKREELFISTGLWIARQFGKVAESKTLARENAQKFPDTQSLDKEQAKLDQEPAQQ